MRASADNTLAKVLVAGTCVATGVYIFGFRESNATKIARLNRQYDQYIDRALQLEQIVELEKLQKFMDTLLPARIYIDDIEQACAPILARYRWIKPWNWGNHMQRAYEDAMRMQQFADACEIMQQYMPYLKRDSALREDENFVKFVNSFAQTESKYPFMFAHERRFMYSFTFAAKCLQFDLERIRVWRSANRSIFYNEIKELLKAIQSHPRYSQELRDQERERLERIKAQALQDQVNAQNRQANAQERLAQAAEKQK